MSWPTTVQWAQAQFKVVSVFIISQYVYIKIYVVAGLEDLLLAKKKENLPTSCLFFLDEVEVQSRKVAQNHA